MGLKIVICDDEAQYRNILREKILQDSFAYDYETEIVEYSCGRELIKALDNSAIADVYFLDIQMENGTDDGICIARELRRRGIKSLIIYVTSFIDYVQIGYEVKAFRYLLKNQIEEKLPMVLGDIRHELSGEDFFSFHISGENIRINKSEIMYIESDRRQLKLYTDNAGDYCFYESMDNVQKALGESFIRCHRSYMVNMAYIKGWKGEQIELTSGTIIPISRSYAKDVKQRLMLELV
ncbi:MAG: response regulator transcription factor [Lachnospiraceae bacterium]|nr:response regulator transcription factor [Lachnospiraceae bacterium]